MKAQVLTKVDSVLLKMFWGTLGTLNLVISAISHEEVISRSFKNCKSNSYIQN